MDFLIATHNNKKKNELQRILAPLGVSVFTADEKNINLREVEETGETFEENAMLKAVSGCEDSGMPCVADDSGLCVDALDGTPGIYSARFGGEHGNDEKNNEKLLDLLKDVPEEKRTARFVSCVCCVFPDGRQLTVRGTVEGVIGYEQKGSNGFGYDPLFVVGERTFAERSDEEKDELSHRGNALRKLVNQLPRYLDADLNDFILKHGKKRYGIMYFGFEDTLELLALCQKTNTEILGVDAFKLSDGDLIQPFSEHSFDFSSDSYNYTWIIDFVSSKKDLGLVFEVVMN